MSYWACWPDWFFRVSTAECVHTARDLELFGTPYSCGHRIYRFMPRGVSVAHSSALDCAWNAGGFGAKGKPWRRAAWTNQTLQAGLTETISISLLHVASTGAGRSALGDGLASRDRSWTSLSDSAPRLQLIRLAVVRRDSARRADIQSHYQLLSPVYRRDKPPLLNSSSFSAVSLPGMVNPVLFEVGVRSSPARRLPVIDGPFSRDTGNAGKCCRNVASAPSR